ncbi:MAG: DUF421 domain-containing protein [Actinomycetota bacterium]
MQIVVRAAVLFIFVWFVVRVSGRKELSELGAFDLVLLIAMGDLIQQGVTQNDTSMTAAIEAVSVFTVLMLVFSYLSFRFEPARKVLEGTPAVIVRNGTPLLDMMKYERLTLDEVKDAAREQGIADLREVSLGLIEGDGKFSFLRESGERSQQDQEHQT